MIKAGSVTDTSSFMLGSPQAGNHRVEGDTEDFQRILLLLLDLLGSGEQASDPAGFISSAGAAEREAAIPPPALESASNHKGENGKGIGARAVSNEGGLLSAGIHSLPGGLSEVELIALLQKEADLDQPQLLSLLKEMLIKAEGASDRGGLSAPNRLILQENSPLKRALVFPEGYTIVEPESKTSSAEHRPQMINLAKAPIEAEEIGRGFKDDMLKMALEQKRVLDILLSSPIPRNFEGKAPSNAAGDRSLGPSKGFLQGNAQSQERAGMLDATFSYQGTKRFLHAEAGQKGLDPGAPTSTGGTLLSVCGVSGLFKQTSGSDSQSALRTAVVDQVIAGIRLLVHKGENRIRLRLHPPSLGHLKVELVVNSDHVRASLYAENELIKGILESNSSHLRESLKEHGLKMEEFTVNVDPNGQGGQGFERGSKDTDGEPAWPLWVSTASEDKQGEGSDPIYAMRALFANDGLHIIV